MVWEVLMEAFLKRGMWEELQRMVQTVREAEKLNLKLANKICSKRR